MNIEVLKLVTGYVELNSENKNKIFILIDSTPCPVLIMNETSKKYEAQDLAFSLGIEDFADKMNSEKNDVFDCFSEIKKKISNELRHYFEKTLEKHEAYYNLTVNKTISYLRSKNISKNALISKNQTINAELKSPSLNSDAHSLSELQIKFLQLYNKLNVIIENYENAQSWVSLVSILANGIKDYQKRNGLSEVQVQNLGHNLIMFLDNAILNDFVGDPIDPYVKSHQENIVLNLVEKKMDTVKQFIEASVA